MNLALKLKIWRPEKEWDSKIAGIVDRAQTRELPGCCCMDVCPVKFQALFIHGNYVWWTLKSTPIDQQLFLVSILI